MIQASMRIDEDVFIGDGEMARLMRAKDWTQTKLGPVTGWPQALKTALRLLLTSRFEMWLGWGDDIHFFYNDAYRPTLGSKHPLGLGTPTQELWSEIWADVQPRLRQVYDTGEATWDRSLLLLLNRNGFPEETYHTFSYSPLHLDDGRVAGVFCAVSEDTDRVISERRMACLGQLAADLVGAETAEATYARALDALTSNGHDVPFVALYRFDDDGRAVLAGSSVSADAPAFTPARDALADTAATWPLHAVWDGTPFEVVPAPALDWPPGPWSQGAAQVAIVPLPGQGSERPRGAMLVGVNPHRPLDRAYREFLSLAAGQVASRLAGVEVFAAERRRAAALAETLELRHQASERLREANARLAEQARVHAEENERLHSLFEQAPSFMCVLEGPDHVFRLVNDAYRTLVGHRDLLGMRVREALPDIEGQGFYELLDQVFATGVPFVGRNLSVQLQRSPGGERERRVLHLVYQPIAAANGAIRGIFVDGYDVTDQREAEDALRQLNDTLEQRVTQRTNQLAEALAQLERESTEREKAQSDLRHAQRMEALGQLTGGVAHDFNNILQVIGANLQLVSKDVVHSDRATRHVQSALGGVSRGAKLASQLLSFGRKQPLEPRVINIGRFIRGIDDMLRHSLGEEVQLETVVAGGLWNTLVDPAQVENALLNLAINARDAMDGGGKLTIEAGNAMLDDDYARQHQDVRAGQYVMIAVTDTGTGIAPDILDRVFEPFFSTKPEGKGTGLGLSMVYGFVKQSGGHVKLYSEPGQGTTARLYFPRAHEVEDVLPQAGRVAPEGGEETILVVEDDDGVRETAVALLQELGYRVLKAREAASAYAIVDSGVPIDLIFTDVVMPGPMRSPELARRARERLPDVGVLFTSGYTENAIVHGGRLDRGVELLSKPYSRESLARKVRHVLDLRRAGAGAAAAVQAPAAPLSPPADAAPACDLLLVEDDADVRAVLTDILDGFGHATRGVGHARDALALIHAAKVDVLITDLGLPEVSGRDLVQQVRALKPALPVIFLTGDTRDPSLREVANAVVLVKPASPERLQAAIRRLVGR